jgi:thiosulfate/3-mercaptopyruvate sulfurtransferase
MLLFNSRVIWIFLLIMMHSGASGAVRESMLVSTDWLAERLGDESLVLLHVGSQQDYAAGHIPGARLVTLSDISITGERGLRLELPPVNALAQALGRLGISDPSRVVVYAGNDSVQSATRVWFTLDYAGLADRSSFLDGGLALWRAEGRPLSTEAPRFEATALRLRVRPEVVVPAEWIREHLHDGGVLLLDARTPEFYTGASAGSMPRAGRIPGAQNVPFPSLFEENRKFKSTGAIRELLRASDAGRESVRVSYCHIGQQATVLYFAARYLGLDVRLYDGSFQDWSSRPELPVE